MAFPLLALPTELILIIGSFLPSLSLNSLSRTSRFFHCLFDKQVWDTVRKTPGWECEILHHAVESGNLQLVKKLLDEFKIPADTENNLLLKKAVDYWQFDLLEFLLKQLHGKRAKKRAVATFIGDLAAKGQHRLIRKLMRLKLSASCLKDAFESGIAYGRDEVVKQALVEYRPDMNKDLRTAVAPLESSVRPHQIWPLLHCAAAQDNEKLVSMLLEHGADINRVDRSGRTALLIATEYKKLKAAKVLLEKGIDMTVRDHEGYTAVTAACSSKMVRLLFEHGATLDLVDWDRTYLYNPFDFVERLEDFGITPKSIPVDPNMLLQCAILRKSKEYVAYFLEHGADVNSTTKMGDRADFRPRVYNSYHCMAVGPPSCRMYKNWTPLHFAASGFVVSITRLLLEKGAQVNPKQGRGVPTPLHLAASKDDQETVELLLSHGANVKATYCPPQIKTRHRGLQHLKSYTVFHSAAESGNAEIWQTLLDTKVEPPMTEESDIVDMLRIVYASHHRHDNTLVHAILETASKKFSFDATEVLKGVASIMIRDQKLDRDIIQALINRGANVNVGSPITLLHEAIRSGDKAIVFLIVRAGANVNYSIDGRPSPLHYAAGSLNPTITRYLLRHGALVNANDPNGFRPLHWAVSLRDPIRDLRPFQTTAKQAWQTAKLLLKYRADANSKTRAKGQTPLHFIIEHGYRSEGAVLAKLLLDKGADVNAKDSNGQTPLHVADANQDYRYILLLLDRGADPDIYDNAGKKALS
ncbi:ankyrin repeat protein [Aspergillus sclerotialis]|uniref:Ankyrin repeat protein n=1 Tax=Aspergillus sclerotialis TaxID=2070753 RepID=A0A3A2Z7N8_9EURO|nr:ankyrin repeat protein [Aspergillus sclerotialis]